MPRNDALRLHNGTQPSQGSYKFDQYVFKGEARRDRRSEKHNLNDTPNNFVSGGSRRPSTSAATATRPAPASGSIAGTQDYFQRRQMRGKQKMTMYKGG